MIGSSDDRTPEERDKNSAKYICKPRIGDVYSYISNSISVQDFHNDYIKFPINKQYLKKLVKNNVPYRLSEHFCNLLIRDPLVTYDDFSELENEDSFCYFENFNCSNWNSLRFKFPRTTDNDNCFKVEVRPCELQLTAFENSAVLAFILLYTKIINKYSVNFIIPISKVDSNSERARVNNAFCEGRFFWRTNSIEEKLIVNNKNCNIWKDCDNSNIENIPPSYFNKDKDLINIKELTLKEILQGKDDYAGLLKIMHHYCDNYLEVDQRETYKQYLLFIEKRACGELWTDAKYIREYVKQHPDYNNNSEINMVKCW